MSDGRTAFELDIWEYGRHNDADNDWAVSIHTSSGWAAGSCDEWVLRLTCTSEDVKYVADDAIPDVQGDTCSGAARSSNTLGRGGTVMLIS